MKSRGLGKGLNALISENVMELPKTKDDGGRKDGIIRIDINKVEPNVKQPRKIFDDDRLEELADSIKQYGIIQPLIVSLKDDYYEIIAGERRWRGAKRAGLKEIPVIINEFNDQEILEISLIENIQREDLNPIEEAKAYRRLIKEFKLKQDEVAKKVSKSRSSITNTLRLLNLDERVQELIIQNSISSGHARALLAIGDQEKQYELAIKIMDEELSVRQIEKFIKALKEGPQQKEEKLDDALAPIFKELEDRIRNVMGTKVHIVSKGDKGGKIEIEYFSHDDLERIMNLIESAK